MEQKKIDRINELARKTKSPAGLTPEERLSGPCCDRSISPPVSPI